MGTVLVTGAGRGIGKVTSIRLARKGWQVYAGVRREADGKALADEVSGIVPVQLDITSTEDVAALDAVLPQTLDAVVNNAGIAIGGPIEAVPLDELRRQLEINVLGQVAVTQAVLPRLRTSRGRVVFVSSLNGRVSQPLVGPYSASKFALEAIADALRMELRPWGIRVSLIEPAQTDTDIWRDAQTTLDESVALLSPAHRVLYAKHIDGVRKAIPLAQKLAAPADGVAAAIEKALTARRPRARYVIGVLPKVQSVMLRFSATPMLDASLSRMSGVPRKV